MRAVAFAAVLATTAACGTTGPAPATTTSPTQSPPAAPPEAESSPTEPTRGALTAATDARDVETLLGAARSPSVETRRAALLGLARVHDDEAVPGLVRGLRDEDPGVRRLAAFGIGALEARATPDAVAALLGALAAEPASDEASGAAELGRTPRAMMVWSLARTTDARAVPALLVALRADGESRIAACRGLAYGPPSGWPEELLAAAIERAGTDASPVVREACLQGLGRTTLPAPLLERAREHALTALSVAPAAEEDDATVEELRVQAARLLGRAPPTDATRAQLALSASDPSWRVAVAAIRSLGAQAAGHEGALAEVLRVLLLPSLPPGGTSPELTGPRLHVALTALEAALPFARAEPVFRVATELMERLDRPSDAPLSRDRGWAHCAAAHLHDAGRGWPARVERCGLEQIGEDERRALAADVIARGEGADPQRASYLTRLFREGGPRAREAASSAASSLPLPLALPLARTGLSDEDTGVTIAALELVTALAPGARRARAASSAAGASERLLSDLDPLLLAAGRRLVAQGSLEGQVSWAGAIEALADPGVSRAPEEQVALLRELAAHASDGVRSAARRALAAVAGDVTPPASARPSAALVAEALALDAREARVVTDRGEIRIELLPETAPTTVTRFVELAEAGFFDGLTFHRVVSGFVAQGGDPRGDGYGGPSFWQRCEDSPLAYERGVVGMALAGRDTGGSQFFITLGPQHHLDGRYTVFGRVREGLGVADALQVGDPIRQVTIVRTD